MIPQFETQEMKRLYDAVYAISRQFSPEKSESIASNILNTTPLKAIGDLEGIVSSKAALLTLTELLEAWKQTEVAPGELAGMLVASSNVVKKITAEQAVELVWTGPTTPFASTRQTEQVLLQVINSAKKELFITSFVTYDVANILMAINLACKRGVAVSILLEQSHEVGGNVSIDGIGHMRKQVPLAHLYAWSDKADIFVHGSVHAKVAVADDHICFITSANLTGHAMEKNMEAGVLVTGGELPTLLHSHLNSLIDVNVITKV